MISMMKGNLMSNNEMNREFLLDEADYKEFCDGKDVSRWWLKNYLIDGEDIATLSNDEISRILRFFQIRERIISQAQKRESFAFRVL